MLLIKFQGAILVVFFVVFVQSKADTVVNHDFDRVFHGTFKYKLNKDANGVITADTDEQIFNEIKEKLENLKYEGDPPEANVKHELRGSTEPEILSYKEISNGNLQVSFRLTFKTNSKVSRRNLALALNDQQGISNAYINSAKKQKIRTTINENSAYKTAENKIVQYMNQSVQPCQDFYEYACGNFKTVHEKDPEVYSAEDLIDKTSVQVHKEFFESKKSGWEPRHKKIARHFYAACTEYFDTEDDVIEYETKMFVNEVIENLGGLPLTDTNWVADDKPTLSEVLAQLQMVRGIPTGLVRPRIAPNIDMSTTTEENDKLYVLEIIYGEFMHLRMDFIEKALIKLGKTVDADQMFELKMLLNVLKSIDLKFKENFRMNGYNTTKPQLMSVENANTKYPLLNLKELIEAYETVLLKETSSDFEFQKLFLDGRTAAYLDELTKQSEAFSTLFKPRNLRNLYLASFLQELDDNVQKTIDHNAKENATARASRVSRECAETFGMEIGLIADRIYVDEYFTLDDRDAEKKRNVMTEMFENIKKAYVVILESNWWLDDESKDKLKRKAESMESIMAYSDYLLDDNHLKSEILDKINRRSNFFEAMEHVNLWNAQQYFQYTKTYHEEKMQLFVSGTIHKYSAHFNREHVIVMHAGLMHDPTYQHDAVMQAITYAYAGMIVAHEIGHGFDNKNVYYDENAKWNDEHFSPREIAEIRKMHKCIVKQYNGFCPFNEEDQVPYRCVSGGMTISENIPDALGLRATFKAYQSLSLAPKRFSGLLADKSAEQIFFLTFAQGQCGKDTKIGRALVLGLLDPHSPNKYRVNGAIQNTPAFGDAFNCPKNARMAPVDHCNIWT